MSAFEAEVETATLGLLRVTLIFGLTCSAILAAIALAPGHDLVDIAVTLGWALAWAAAVTRPATVARLLRDHPVMFAAGVSSASAAAIVATGGIESMTIVDANWIIWGASVVVSTRTVIGIASTLSASHLVAFLIAGMPISAIVSGADAYQVVTQILNPLVIAAAALALTGVFQALLLRTPELLAGWRTGPRSRRTLTNRQLLELPTAAIGRSPDPADQNSELLTPAEADVVARLAAGAKPKQIAHETRRSVHTIYEHIANAKRKCAARTTAQLVSRAWRPAS